MGQKWKGQQAHQMLQPAWKFCTCCSGTPWLGHPLVFPGRDCVKWKPIPGNSSPIPHPVHLGQAIKTGHCQQQLSMSCVVLISVSSYFCTYCVWKRVGKKAHPGQLGWSTRKVACANECLQKCRWSILSMCLPSLLHTLYISSSLPGQLQAFLLLWAAHTSAFSHSLLRCHHSEELFLLPLTSHQLATLMCVHA